MDRCNLQMMMNEVSILVPAKNMEIRLLLHQISYTEYLNRRGTGIISRMGVRKKFL